MTAPGMARLLAWFAADAEAEGQTADRCGKCGTWLRDGSTVRPCPVCVGRRRRG